MATKQELAVLEGQDTIAYARKLSDESKVSGQLIPWQTGLSFDPSVDSDSTATKQGPVNTRGSAATDAEVDFLNNASAIADAMYDSLFDGEVIEVWNVYRKRRNAEGKYFAWYYQATVGEDSNDNDPDDHSTREVTFSVNGTPKRGWVTLNAEAQAEIDYIFRGLGVVTEDNPSGDGTAWDKENDPGTNVADSDITVPTPTPDPAKSETETGDGATA